MVMEIRRIAFSGEELRTALTELVRRGKVELPPGVIVSCALSEDSPAQAIFTFRNDLLEESHDLQIDGNTVGAVLVGYCIRQRIPLPRDSDKGLDLFKGELCLTIRGRSAAPAEAAAAES